MLASLVLALAMSSGETLEQTGYRLTKEVPPAAVQVVEVNKIADDVADDVVWIVQSHAVDLFTTALSLNRCPTCRESNPLGFNSEARIAMKMFGAAGSALTCYKLRRVRKNREATILRWTIVAVNGALTLNNSVHAIRRR